MYAISKLSSGQERMNARREASTSGGTSIRRRISSTVLPFSSRANRPCASKAGDIGSQSSGSLVTQMSTACRNGDSSTSGIVSSKCKFVTVIANEQNLRLVVFGDVLTALKKCKELVT